MNTREPLRVLDRVAPPSPLGCRDLRTRSLYESKPGKRLRIFAVQLEADQRDALYKRGVVEGRMIRLLHNDFRARVALEVDGIQLILGLNDSRRILVREA